MRDDCLGAPICHGNQAKAGAYVFRQDRARFPLKSKRYYLEQAAYMRRLAKEAQTEALRKSCLKKAESYEELAKKPEGAADQE